MPVGCGARAEVEPDSQTVVVTEFLLNYGEGIGESFTSRLFVVPFTLTDATCPEEAPTRRI